MKKCRHFGKKISYLAATTLVGPDDNVSRVQTSLLPSVLFFGFSGAIKFAAPLQEVCFLLDTGTIKNVALTAENKSFYSISFLVQKMVDDVQF